MQRGIFVVTGSASLAVLVGHVLCAALALVNPCLLVGRRRREGVLGAGVCPGQKRVAVKRGCGWVALVLY